MACCTHVGSAPYFTKICAYVSFSAFFRMANRNGQGVDGRYGEDTDEEIDGKVSGVSPPRWTGVKILGDGEEIVASLSFPSSDSFPKLHVPSAGPSVRYTASSGPMAQSSSHTGTSVSATHVYVGRVETAGVDNNVGWALNPFRRCPVHSTSWQAGCAVCDRTLSLLPKPTAVVPKSLATSVRSSRKKDTDSTYSAGLDLVEQGVARHVGHRKSEPLTINSVDQLSLANLMVSPAQEWTSGYDLQLEAFLQNFERRRISKQQLVYRGKLIELLEGMRQSMTPLFSLTNELAGFEAKLKLYCEEIGITLALLDRNISFKKGVSSHSHPISVGGGYDISVLSLNPADFLAGLGLHPDILSRVHRRINQVHQANSRTVEAGLSRLQDSFCRVYDLSSKLAFATCEDLEFFFRLSGFHDEALGILLRHRLLLLTEHMGRRAFVESPRQSGGGLKVGDKAGPHGSVQSEESGSIPTVPLFPPNPKPKSKKKKKKTSFKTETAGSSRNKDGEVLDAGWVQVIKNYRATKKAKVEKVKSDNAAKTGGASAAP